MFSRMLVCAGLAAVLVAPAVRAQDAPVRVGVCNPAKVFQALDERKAIEDRMTEERNKVKSDATKRKLEVDDLKTARDQLKPESPAYQEKTNQMMEKAIQFEVWARVKEAEMGRAEKEQIRGLYEKIRDACREIAAEQKLDLVLAERKPEIPANMEQLNPKQLGDLLMANDVLYMNEKADVTQEVILRLNKKYSTGSASLK
jgi:Skp family chaperone for outer membrane proteins